MAAGKRIKETRIDINLTQEQFGEAIGVSGNYISEIENEKKNPSEPIYLAIEFKYGVNGAWLKKGTGEKYVQEKFPPTKKEVEFIQSFREMSAEDKKMFLALFDKLRRK